MTYEQGNITKIKALNAELRRRKKNERDIIQR